MLQSGSAMNTLKVLWIILAEWLLTMSGLEDMENWE